MDILALNTDMDEAMLRKLRGKCVDDVKRSVGAVTFENMVDSNTANNTGRHPLIGVVR